MLRMIKMLNPIELEKLVAAANVECKGHLNTVVSKSRWYEFNADKPRENDAWGFQIGSHYDGMKLVRLMNGDEDTEKNVKYEATAKLVAMLITNADILAAAASKVYKDNVIELARSDEISSSDFLSYCIKHGIDVQSIGFKSINAEEG